jgi:hypothetical protein
VDVRPTDEQPLDRVGVGLPGVRVRLALFVGRLAQELDLRPLGNLLEELAAPLLAVAEGSARRVLLASVALECRRRLDVVAGQRPEHRLAVFDDQQSVRRLARGDVERVGVELVGALVRRRCDRRRQVVEDVVDGLGIDDSGVDDEPVLGGRLVLVEDPSRPFQRLGGALARPVGVDVLGLGYPLRARARRRRLFGRDRERDEVGPVCGRVRYVGCSVANVVGGRHRMESRVVGFGVDRRGRISPGGAHCGAACVVTRMNSAVER